MSHQDPTNADLVILVNKVIKQNEELSRQVAPVVLWFDNFTMGKRLTLGFLKGVAWAAGVVIALSTAIGLIWVAFKYVISQASLK